MPQTDVAKKATVDFKAGERITVIAVPRKNCMFAQGEQSSRSVELPAKRFSESGWLSAMNFKRVSAPLRIS